MLKWALTVLLVLSAPIVLYTGRTALDLPGYLIQQWPLGGLLTGGGLWNLFLRLIPMLWLLCAVRVVVVWRRKSSDPPMHRMLNVVVGSLLFTLTTVTAFFIYVFWAWSQM